MKDFNYFKESLSWVKPLFESEETTEEDDVKKAYDILWEKTRSLGENIEILSESDIIFRVKLSGEKHVDLKFGKNVTWKAIDNSYNK